jgi:hypothetical protein
MWSSGSALDGGDYSEGGGMAGQAPTGRLWPAAEHGPGRGTGRAQTLRGCRFIERQADGELFRCELKGRLPPAAPLSQTDGARRRRAETTPMIPWCSRFWAYVYHVSTPGETTSLVRCEEPLLDGVPEQEHEPQKWINRRNPTIRAFLTRGVFAVAYFDRVRHWTR